MNPDILTWKNTSAKAKGQPCQQQATSPLENLGHGLVYFNGLTCATCSNPSSQVSHCYCLEESITNLEGFEHGGVKETSNRNLFK